MFIISIRCQVRSILWKLNLFVFPRVADGRGAATSSFFISYSYHCRYLGAFLLGSWEHLDIKNQLLSYSLYPILDMLRFKLRDFFRKRSNLLLSALFTCLPCSPSWSRFHVFTEKVYSLYELISINLRIYVVRVILPLTILLLHYFMWCFKR